MSYESERQIEVLLIEDNSGDVLLTKEAFDETGFKEKMIIARDGEDAMDYLYKRGPYENANSPDLILLDLNLPKKDGREILAEIKKDDNLRQIPVIVLTTSRSEKDINKCYELQANCYIIKPVGFDEFLDIVKSIQEFWIDTVKLPSMPGR